jgi:hypothetical protein
LVFQKPTACTLFGSARACSGQGRRLQRNMSKRQRTEHAESADTPLDLSHLRRETRTALELAVVALAPSDLVDRLAGVAGLLEAIAELPPDSAPVLALVPTLSKRARTALADWSAWQADHLAKSKA